MTTTRQWKRQAAGLWDLVETQEYFAQYGSPEAPPQTREVQIAYLRRVGRDGRRWSCVFSFRNQYYSIMFPETFPGVKRALALADAWIYATTAAADAAERLRG